MLQSQNPKRIYFFIALLISVYILWLGYFLLKDQWHLFIAHWQISMTMILGSFVAGSSAVGGGAVAFPVFTKVLQISPEEARTFSLMIQTVGMGMASVFIWAKGIKVLWKVIFIASIGGFLGILIGTFWLQIPSPYQKLTLSYVLLIFGAVLAYSTWGKKSVVVQDIEYYSWRRILSLLGIGFVGGLLSANVGSGTDILVFILLTLTFGIHERIGTPTSAIIMAINAAFGFFFHALFIKDIIPVYDMWLVCIPVVIIGAPLGAFVISRTKRHYIIIFLLTLILLEFISTLMLIPQNYWSMLFGVSLFLVMGYTFWLMLQYRTRFIRGG